MTDFLGLGAAAIAACAFAMLAGGTVKGVVGVGLPLVALPVMASFITVPKAIALLLLPSFATSVWQTFHGGQFSVSVRRLWPFLIGMAAGTWVSVRLLASFDARTLYLILGAIVAIFAAVLYRRLVFSVGPRAEPWAGPAVGAASGAKPVIAGGGNHGGVVSGKGEGGEEDVAFLRGGLCEAFAQQGI